MNLVAGASVALIASIGLGCAGAAVDTRPLSDAEREALIREQQTVALRRDVGAPGNARTGCAQSSMSSRLNARRTDYQGADSFDSRGCVEAPPPRAVMPVPPKPAP